LPRTPGDVNACAFLLLFKLLLALDRANGMTGDGDDADAIVSLSARSASLMSYRRWPLSGRERVVGTDESERSDERW
jgi:hypothetical protein